VVVASNPTGGIDVFVHLFCLGVDALRHGFIPRPRSPMDCVQDQGNEKTDKGQQMGSRVTKIKIKFSLCLIKLYAMNTYGLVHV
jgi:hypothetical protein